MTSARALSVVSSPRWSTVTRRSVASRRMTANAWSSVVPATNRSTSRSNGPDSTRRRTTGERPAASTAVLSTATSPVRIPLDDSATARRWPGVARLPRVVDTPGTAGATRSGGPDMDATTTTPVPRNEPQRTYAPGSAERASLQAALAELGAEQQELTVTVDGRQHLAGGARFDVVAPHDHAHVLGTSANATAEDAKSAVEAALRAGPAWRALPYDERAAVLLRAADLLSGPWRDRLNAATMLGQSKTCYQAEIDAACELADFWRFNAHYGRRLLEEQPASSPGVWNRMDFRPLEGFVYAITPFNFTAIAGNLPTAPALMGNAVIWKPSPTRAWPRT